MNIIFNAFLLIILVHQQIGYKSAVDCAHIKKEISVFKTFLPSALSLYKDQFYSCGIHEIDGILITDYLNIESDTLLTFGYLTQKDKKFYEPIAKYYVDNSRWDLLLRMLDNGKNFSTFDKIKMIEFLFYQNVPNYIRAETKYIFDQLTENERLKIAQLLLAPSTKKLVDFKKEQIYIYKYWPLFDQLVFLIFLRDHSPQAFDELRVFWEKVLKSKYSYNKEDPTMILFFQVLNREDVSEGLSAVNPSFLYFYYIKTAQFSLAKSLIQKNKDIYFNVIKYFDLFSPEQQKFLLSTQLNFSISDIQRLFQNYFLISNSSYHKWLWELAISQKFNVEDYLNNSHRYIYTLPVEYWSKLKTLSPKAHKLTSKIKSKKLNRRNLLSISKTLNYKHEDIIPYLSPKNFDDYLDVLPYITQEQKIEIVNRHKSLQTVPESYRKRWYKFVGRWLKK